MARDWPVPPDAGTIHFIPDLHWGDTAAIPGITATRRDKVLADLTTSRLLPDPLARIQIGDLTQLGEPTIEDPGGIAWMNSLPGEMPKRVLVGNHDLINWNLATGVADRRTGDATAAIYGFNDKNFVDDFDDFKVIGIGPDILPGDGVTCNYTTATLDWLADELDAATKDCLIAAHAPLADSVVGDPAEVHTSATPAFAAQPDDDIADLLDDHPQAKAWISGHTHSPISTTDFIKLHSVGSRNIITANTGGLVYTGKTVEVFGDPLRSVFMTHTGTALAFRVRDHGGGAWVTWPDGTRAKSIAIS